MFKDLSPQPQDAILALMGLFKADQRANKIDLGVGVFRNEKGETPVMAAVKKAEHFILETQDSKSYVAPEGDDAFINALATLILPQTNGHHVAGVQTPGGSGALRLAADLLAHGKNKRIWLGLPSWPNHAGIFKAVGLDVKTYAYFDIASQSLNFDAMVEGLKQAEPGDAVLLHASCHNPTGADLTPDQWQIIAALLQERHLVPLIDSAYQGFGDGLHEDLAGLRLVINSVPETLLAVSCSKCFGLYRDRIGAVYAISDNSNDAALARANLISMARVNYSMPPDHGAAIVTKILTDQSLHALWIDELATMGTRIISLRSAFAKALLPHWSLAHSIEGQKGMFSSLPLKPEQALALRNDHAIYIPGSGRINIAGLNLNDIDTVAHALAPYLGQSK